ncbi:hypothetical protein PITCH_A630002 [uncultured Desulfobacterium sp.]|uniref:Uncharacterized protein n=1 Tax=uncultured Desulfobacterium sp. TaxID=201089 RepID=A0A445N161_9BACT|nr:hypothetical protein PITCH_A630002 [uncultured Desulfobacterium sp.]
MCDAALFSRNQLNKAIFNDCKHLDGRSMRYIRLSLLIFMFSGCIPYSENPLTAPGEQGLDQKIMGSWYYHDRDETVFLHIGKDSKTKGLRLVMAEFHKDNEIVVYVFVGHTSLVGDKTYLNLRWDQPDEQDKGYLFAKYNMKGEQLGLGLIRADSVETAIREGKIRGKIGEGEEASVIITDSPERLRGFFQKHDKELFEQIQYMKRLNNLVTQKQ